MPLPNQTPSKSSQQPKKPQTSKKPQTTTQETISRKTPELKTSIEETNLDRTSTSVQNLLSQGYTKTVDPNTGETHLFGNTITEKDSLGWDRTFPKTEYVYDGNGFLKAINNYTVTLTSAGTPYINSTKNYDYFGGTWNYVTRRRPGDNFQNSGSGSIDYNDPTMYGTLQTPRIYNLKTEITGTKEGQLTQQKKLYNQIKAAKKYGNLAFQGTYEYQLDKEALTKEGWTFTEGPGGITIAKSPTTTANKAWDKDYGWTQPVDYSPTWNYYDSTGRLVRTDSYKMGLIERSSTGAWSFYEPVADSKRYYYESNLIENNPWKAPQTFMHTSQLAENEQKQMISGIMDKYQVPQAEAAKILESMKPSNIAKDKYHQETLKKWAQWKKIESDKKEIKNLDEQGIKTANDYFNKMKTLKNLGIINDWNKDAEFVNKNYSKMGVNNAKEYFDMQKGLVTTQINTPPETKLFTDEVKNKQSIRLGDLYQQSRPDENTPRTKVTDKGSFDKPTLTEQQEIEMSNKGIFSSIPLSMKHWGTNVAEKTTYFLKNPRMLITEAANVGEYNYEAQKKHYQQFKQEVEKQIAEKKATGKIQNEMQANMYRTKKAYEFVQRAQLVLVGTAANTLTSEITQPRDWHEYEKQQAKKQERILTNNELAINAGKSALSAALLATGSKSAKDGAQFVMTALAQVGRKIGGSSLKQSMYNLGVQATATTLAKTGELLEKKWQLDLVRDLSRSGVKGLTGKPTEAKQDFTIQAANLAGFKAGEIGYQGTKKMVKMALNKNVETIPEAEYGKQMLKKNPATFDVDPAVKGRSILYRYGFWAKKQTPRKDAYNPGGKGDKQIFFRHTRPGKKEPITLTLPQFESGQSYWKMLKENLQGKKLKEWTRTIADVPIEPKGLIVQGRYHKTVRQGKAQSWYEKAQDQLATKGKLDKKMQKEGKDSAITEKKRKAKFYEENELAWKKEWDIRKELGKDYVTKWTYDPKQGKEIPVLVAKRLANKLASNPKGVKQGFIKEAQRYVKENLGFMNKYGEAGILPREHNLKHFKAVERNAEALAKRLELNQETTLAAKVAAKLHDLAKKQEASNKELYMTHGQMIETVIGKAKRRQELGLTKQEWQILKEKRKEIMDAVKHHDDAGFWRTPNRLGYKIMDKLGRRKMIGKLLETADRQDLPRYGIKVKQKMLPLNEKKIEKILTKKAMTKEFKKLLKKANKEKINLFKTIGLTDKQTEILRNKMMNAKYAEFVNTKTGKTIRIKKPTNKINFKFLKNIPEKTLLKIKIRFKELAKKTDKIEKKTREYYENTRRRTQTTARRYIVDEPRRANDRRREDYRTKRRLETRRENRRNTQRTSYRNNKKTDYRYNKPRDYPTPGYNYRYNPYTPITETPRRPTTKIKSEYSQRKAMLPQGSEQGVTAFEIKYGTETGKEKTGPKYATYKEAMMEAMRIIDETPDTQFTIVSTTADKGELRTARPYNRNYKFTKIDNTIYEKKQYRKDLEKKYEGKRQKRFNIMPYIFPTKG